MKLNDYTIGSEVNVEDSMQRYHYVLQEVPGRNFSVNFTPNLTPQQMLELGVFGGDYFHNEHSEFPEEWFNSAKLSAEHNPHLNFFQVDASQPLQEWQSKGWIYEEDPRGWFQWYCRFFLGRRTDDDPRQITRWLRLAGPKGRFRGQLIQLCLRKHKAFNDFTVSPVIRQTLLHWAYELTRTDFEKFRSRHR